MKKRIIVLAGILAVIAAASVLWAKSSPHEADDHHQTITWSTNEIKQSMATEESKTVVVTFHSRVNLSKISIVASSSIDEVVSVNPESFNSIQANRSYQISVTFQAPNQSRREEYNGVIELRDTSKHGGNDETRAYAEPLRVKLEIEKQSPARISWSTEEINARLSPKGNTVVPLTFTSSADLMNVVLILSPEIAPFISVQPNSISSIQAGKPQSLLFSIYIPASTSIKTYDGTVQIRNASSPPRTYSKPLPIILKVSSSNGALPPDPSEAGKITLAGIDTDGDGVRDDVERLIAFMNISVQQSSILQDIAKNMQQDITIAMPKDDAIQQIRQELTSGECLRYLLGTEQAIALKKQVREAMLNTRERLLAYAAIDALFGGETTLDLLEGQAACTGQ
jgi:hypothetical protein